MMSHFSFLDMVVPRKLNDTKMKIVTDVKGWKSGVTIISTVFGVFGSKLVVTTPGLQKTCHQQTLGSSPLALWKHSNQYRDWRGGAIEHQLVVLQYWWFWCLMGFFSSRTCWLLFVRKSVTNQAQIARMVLPTGMQTAPCNRSLGFLGAVTIV